MGGNYPLVNATSAYIANWNSTLFISKSAINGPFSVVMLVYLRVILERGMKGFTLVLVAWVRCFTGATCG